MILILPSQALVLNAYAVLVGSKPGNAALKEHQAFINTAGVGEAGYKAALENFASGSFTTATLATALLTNLGLGAVFTQAQAEAYLNANPGNRVGKMMDLGGQLYSYSGTDATLLAAKAAYVARITDSYTYSNDAVNNNTQIFAGTGVQTLALTTGMDKLGGSGGNDLYNAYIVNNANTLQNGDTIDGSLGFDTLFAEIGVSQDVIISPRTTSVENVVIRAQGIKAVTGDNNIAIDGAQQIDAQNMSGVTFWESNNSRADVIIEDVRILASQITKDITIAMVETEAGHVDYGVYFDQLSLRNASTSSSQLNLQVMDTRSVVNGTAPLLNSPYGGFVFTATNTATAESAVITLQSAAIDNAQTYAELAAAFQVALDARFPGAGITATVSSNFTVNDTTTGTVVTGQEIKISTAGAFTFTTPTGSGWLANGVVPANSGLHTNFNTATSASTDLVTSKVILDDVGRGSTGGDLVIGGISVGDTSTSKGVERFEIEVRDNSKLQTINSTNNTLKEVTIVNGLTTSQSFAYVATVKDAGKLTVNGTVNNLDATSNEANNSDAWNAPLPGTQNQHNAFGFSDVRLIDASAMRGDVAFTAEVTEASIAKYLNLRDTANSPTADNVAFVYTTGAGNDTMSVSIDSAVAASRTLTGQADFTITIDGGAGNDAITTVFGGNKTASWLVDQALNANVSVNGGLGNDTITTTGAGNVKIDAGAGNDTVYTDNSGAKATWVVNATNTVLADLSADVGVRSAVTATAPVGANFLFGGKLTVAFSGAAAGGGVTAGASVSTTGAVGAARTLGYEVTVDIPTDTNFKVTQFHINQAIKKAINDDPVLNKLLVAADGPSNTLTITTKIDGAFATTDLSMTVTNTAMTAADTAALTAYQALVSNTTTALLADAQGAATATVTSINGLVGFSAAAAGLGSVFGTTATVVPAVTEVATVTVLDTAAGDTQVINGMTFTAVGVLGTAANMELAMESGASNAGVTVTGAYGPGWTVSVGGAGTVVYTSTTAGTNVADLNVGGTDATPSTVVSVQGAVATAGVATSTGSQSTANSDNTINMGAGQDVLVLSTSATSNEKIVFTGTGINTTIVNFDATAAGAASADSLNFLSYLGGKATVTGVAKTIDQTASLTAANVAQTIDANEVAVLSGAGFTTTAGATFAGLTDTTMLAALNGTAYASIGGANIFTHATAQTAAQLNGGIGNAVILVENNLNEGQYAAFNVSWNATGVVATAGTFTSATLIGTVDFGDSLPLLVVGGTLATS